jgi:hypothetical protein
MYLRRASRDFDPLAERAAAVALEAGRTRRSERIEHNGGEEVPS